MILEISISIISFFAGLIIGAKAYKHRVKLEAWAKNKLLTSGFG